MSIIRNNILCGPDFHIPVPNISVGLHLFDKLKSRNVNEIAFKNHVTQETVTVEKVIKDSEKLSKILTRLVSKNQIIAVCADNHVNYPTVLLGALIAGVPLALMNPTYTSYELKNLLDIIQPELIFCSEENKEILKETKNQSIKKLIAINSDEFDAFLRTELIEDIKMMMINPKEDLALILFSSGTTGLPKAVTMTHFSINASLIGISHPMVMTTEPEIGLGVLPFFHLYGVYSILLSVYKQKPIIILEHFNPFDYLECIQTYKIDYLQGVPPLLNFLAKSPVVDNYDLSSLTKITCGSAPVSESVLEAVKKKFKLDQVQQAYGTSEAHMMISCTPPNCHKPSSVGLVGPGTKVTIKNVETGENLPANHEGEICVKSDMMMKGYYKNDKATAETFTSDGWLKTGDIGYYDDEGFLYIIDRIKELIKYKGFQVAPAEIEAVLMKHPKIADAGVVGRPVKDLGELPVAFVVKQEDSDDLTQEEVKNFVAKHLNRNKHLHGGVYFIDEIPRVKAGKIKRSELRILLDNMTKSKL